jgi:hypothetical protein
MDRGGAELVVWTGRRVLYSYHKSHYRLLFEGVHCAFHYSHASVACAIGDAAHLDVLYKVKKITHNVKAQRMSYVRSSVRL